jgi:RNA recognition motif-containing protein
MLLKKLKNIAFKEGGKEMQGNKLYVGNLNYAVKEEQLKELFENHGTVQSVNIIEGKGFGFVEMSTNEEAEAAKEALNNQEFQGRPLKIDEARPRQPRRDFNPGSRKRY